MDSPCWSWRRHWETVNIRSRNQEIEVIGRQRRFGAHPPGVVGFSKWREHPKWWCNLHHQQPLFLLVLFGFFEPHDYPLVILSFVTPSWRPVVGVDEFGRRSLLHVAIANHRHPGKGKHIAVGDRNWVTPLVLCVFKVTKNVWCYDICFWWLKKFI